MLKSGVTLKLSSGRIAINPHRRDDDPRYVWRCFAAALWANNVKLRMPRSRSALCRPLLAALSLVLARVWHGL